MSEKIAISLHESPGNGDDWWAECLLCDWVPTSNAERRVAEEKYGRHYERDHRRGER